MDFVGLPVYSWGCAEGHASGWPLDHGRSHVLVARTMSPERLAVIRTYCGSPSSSDQIELELVRHDPSTGGVDLADLERKLSPRTSRGALRQPFVPRHDRAARGRDRRARPRPRSGGRSSASTGLARDPRTARSYGAGHRRRQHAAARRAHVGRRRRPAGSSPRETIHSYAHEYPTLLLSISETVAGEHGFGIALFEQTSTAVARRATTDGQLGLSLGRRERRVHGGSWGPRASRSSVG
jgi:glycine dehydrogenase subunit 1